MGLTLNAIKANAAHPARQVQVGEIADSRYDAGTLLNPPSLAALKLQDLLMKAAGGSVVEDRWHTLPISTIKTQVGMKNATRAEIIGWLRELRGAVLEYQNLKDGYTGIYGLLGAGRVEFDESRGVMKFRFDDEFRKVADESNLYAVLDRQTALQLSSRYAHRLHEIIALKAGRAKSSQEFDLEDIRARLGVPAGKLSAWIDFRRKALEAAIDEVNKQSRFKVSYRITGKKGRKVAKVTLEWEVLADLDWDHPGPRRRIQPDAAVGFLDIGQCCGGIRWSLTPRDWHEHAGRECYGQMGGAKGLVRDRSCQLSSAGKGAAHAAS